MTRPYTADRLRKLVLISAAIGALPLPAQAADVDLVVYCDVSTSLRPEVILSEPDIIFRFINNKDFFPNGKFAIHIADRDVEREPPVRGEKLATRYKDDEIIQVGRLNQLREQLRKSLAEYCKRHPARDRTCLVKALHSAPRLFQNQSAPQNRKLLIVSDMLEDCHGQGDAKTAAQLQSRLGQSLAEYQLSDLNGVQVFASLVSSAAEPLDIEILRTIWRKTLEGAHASFALGTMDALINNPISQR